MLAANVISSRAHDDAQNQASLQNAELAACNTLASRPKHFAEPR